jgi:high-affinity nickel-transport protein
LFLGKNVGGLIIPRCILLASYLDLVCEINRRAIRQVFISLLHPGFDTASSIALLAISALAKKGADGKSIPPADIVLLPVTTTPSTKVPFDTDERLKLLFTAGMTLIDSTDSVLMLYSYSGFPERSWAIFERSSSIPAFDVEQREGQEETQSSSVAPISGTRLSLNESTMAPQRPLSIAPQQSITSLSHPQASRKSAHSDTRVNDEVEVVDTEDKTTRDLRVKMNMMSGLSIILTMMSILVAFR